MYIDGRFVEPAGGQFFESDNPYTGEPWALIPRGNADDVDRAVRAAHKALTSGPWPKTDGNAARCAAAEARRSGGGEREGTGRARGARQRQAVRRDERAAELHSAVVLLLRRTRRQDRGLGHPHRQARHVQLHQVRADRRRCGDHSVELAAAAHGVEAGAGARGRQHDRHQAIGVHVRFGARRSSSSSNRPGSRPASSTSSPASARRSARRLSSIRSSRRWRSPVPMRRDRRSTKRPPAA